MTHDEPTDDPGGANSTRSTDSASSPPTERTERFWLIATGLLLVTMPAFTLVVAYAVLLATQSVLVGNITTVELRRTVPHRTAGVRAVRVPAVPPDGVLLPTTRPGRTASQREGRHGVRPRNRDRHGVALNASDRSSPASKLRFPEPVFARRPPRRRCRP
ncbi:hypothetical protein ACFQRB_17580 [Halobaculum litoreum]|uniref:Uncharacterized protein n=1 Tax=Halobaculum litoreum TaxID=3031998 RepID=A0ABD5XRU5_9EURY